MTRDWQEWYQEYDDPSSSLWRRLEEVRRLLAADLDERAAAGQTSVRLLSLCAGDGRDTIPVLVARPDLEVDACLVELDPGLADAARAQFAVRELSEEQARTIGYGQRVDSAAPGRTTPVAAFAPDGTLVAMLDESGHKARSHVVFAPAGS